MCVAYCMQGGATIYVADSEEDLDNGKSTVWTTDRVVKDMDVQAAMLARRDFINEMSVYEPCTELRWV